jgi:phage shock protein A
MNRLFSSLRKLVEKAPAEDTPALPGFENRVEVLYRYVEQAAAYEDELTAHLEQVQGQLDQLQERVEKALDAGKDRDAFEFIRLAARLRPQFDLLNEEIKSFHAVAADLMLRVNKLMDNIDEARRLAEDGDFSPVATHALDETLTRLTRHFVNLDRVATARRRALPERLAQQLTRVIDDRQLDLELANYILKRRRALGPG